MINKLLSILLVLVLFSSGCTNNKPVIMNFKGFIQGSTYSIVYDNNMKISPDDMKQKVEKILHDFDMSLSVYVDSSIISRINRNEDVKVDSNFTEVFNKSAIISKMTDGAFDITVGPLVRAWGFGPDAQKTFKEEKRDSLLDLVGMEKVSLKNGRVIKSKPGIVLDANAIAQGYCVDVVCNFFEKLGFKNYLVEIGGEVRAVGKKGKAIWRIGIDRPEDNNLTPGQDLEGIIKITDKSISTSGNYRKFYIEDGIKYSHEIDPKTGYPAKNTLLSATIIADDCAMADGLATAAMVMGKEKFIKFLDSHPEVQAYLIYSDETGNFKTWTSETLKSAISETGKE
jgi:thiamine biosynthesis lipoprotein